MDLRDKADYLHQRDKKFLSHPSEDLTHCAQLLNKIGQIVQLKCEPLKGIGEPVYCGYWSIIPFMVFNHQIRDLKELVCMLPRMMEELVQRSVHSSLTYALYSEVEESSKQAYKILWTNLCCNLSNNEITDKGPVYLIESARKRFSINLDEILTFIKWFIDHCSSKDAKKNVIEAFGTIRVLENYKKDIIKYKNSLLITNHFKHNLNPSYILLSDCK